MKNGPKNGNETIITAKEYYVILKKLEALMNARC